MAEAKTGHTHEHHILPLRTYVGVGAALLVLTIITVLAAQIDLGAMNVVLAMVIAGSKAALVALFFMHLKYDSKLYMISFIGAIIFLALFITFSMADTERRGDIYEYRSDPIKPDAVIYENQATAPGMDSLAGTVPPDSLGPAAETGQKEQTGVSGESQSDTAGSSAPQSP